MGCDDHAYLEWDECGVPYDPYWICVSRQILDRYYGLYSIMAGVRARPDDAPPIFPPRGLPDKLSVDVEWAFEEWKLDAHHTTWFTVEELRAVQDRFRLLPDKTGVGKPHKVLAATIAMMDVLNEGDVNRTRLIVWWDN